jgi:hypothetical protein
MVYDCHCCRMIASDFCRCVIGTCLGCSLCLTHCSCPLRHTRGCGLDPDLDAPDGPFGDLADDGWGRPAAG